MVPGKVLLIDSDADSIAIYSLILQHHGYDVIFADSGEAGLRLAFDSRPDLVVSEIFLTSGDGAEVVNRLRQDERTARTPLIVLDSIPAIAEALASADELSRLTKPCEPSRLLQEVEKFLPRPLATPADLPALQ